jgi:hypothetical protein
MTSLWPNDSDFCGFNQRRYKRSMKGTDGTLPDQSPVLAALDAGLVLAVAGSKASGAEYLGTYPLALRISVRTTGKTRIRGRGGQSLPHAAGFRSPDQRNQK